jgi:hypothetical protein
MTEKPPPPSGPSPLGLLEWKLRRERHERAMALREPSLTEVRMAALDASLRLWTRSLVTRGFSDRDVVDVARTFEAYLTELPPIPGL